MGFGHECHGHWLDCYRDRSGRHGNRFRSKCREQQCCCSRVGIGDVRCSCYHGCYA
ncbi:hypothetical protein EMIT0158MI4_20641 [Burkholderia ambifaria]